MEATFIKFNKKSIFQNFISRNLELRTVKQRPHIFTRLERPPSPISDRGRIAGVCCPNQIKNHHFVICRTLTSYLSLNFIITNNHTELQSPRGRRFVCCPGLLFTEHLGLHQTRTYLSVAALFSTIYRQL